MPQSMIRQRCIIDIGMMMPIWHVGREGLKAPPCTLFDCFTINILSYSQWYHIGPSVMYPLSCTTDGIFTVAGIN